MSDQLTATEAQALFHATSKAIRDQDPEKLSALYADKQPLIEEVTPEPEVVPAVEPEPSTEDIKETPPLEEADPLVEQKEPVKEEPNELETLKAKLDKLANENHALRSQAGRVPHVQRRIKELDAKLDAITKAATSNQTSTKIEPQIQDALKGVRETDPELADAIAKAIIKATSEIATDAATKERDTLTLLRDQNETEYGEHEAERLLQMYPNAVEVVTSDAWAEWKKAQSPGILALAQSDNADEVSHAFQKYANDMVILYPDLASKNEEVEPTPVKKNDSEQALKIEAERKRVKEASVNIGSSVTPAKIASPDDPHALFEQLSANIRKARSG